MPWFQKLDIKNIDLGKGKRQIAANGILNKKYQITVPDEIATIEYYGFHLRLGVKAYIKYES